MNPNLLLLELAKDFPSERRYRSDAENRAVDYLVQLGLVYDKVYELEFETSSLEA